MKNKLLVFLLIFTCFAIGQTTKAVTIRTYTVEEIQQRYAGSIVVEDLNFERRYWYIDALSQERYPLKDGITITRLLKKLGHGISNQDLAKIPENLESTNIDYKLKLIIQFYLLFLL